MRRALRALRTLLAFAMPAYLVLLMTLAVQGAISPWPPARAVLARHPGQVPVMVGMATHARQLPGRGLESTKSRYYVLLPEALREPRLLRITQVDSATATESASRAGFWALLAAVAACAVGTWWFWLPPRGLARGPRP